MRPFLRKTKNFKQLRAKGRQCVKYKWGWKLKCGKVPVQGGCDSLLHALRCLAEEWIYAFKYPTPISKTFWQVVKLKFFSKQ